MPTIRCSYEMEVRSPVLRRRLCRAMEIELCFHPFSNPVVTAGWFSNAIRVQFDCFASEVDPDWELIEGQFHSRIVGYILGTEEFPYGRRDPVLGQMKWRPYLWRGEYPWRAGEVVWFQFWADCKPGPLAAARRILTGPWFSQTAAQQARLVLPQLEKLNDKWLDGATSEMLPVFNSNWNEGPPLDAQRFRSRLSLQGIEFRDDGSARVYYSQDELFTDHDVTVEVDRAGNVQGTGLEG